MLSMVWRLLGSIKLAVPLLSAIALILIGATFYEGQVGAATVQYVIYKSLWFGALMFLLAVNLGVSALSRYPWRGARKIGFALTHLGLIVLIAGSAAVIHLSVEGMLLLRTDGPASNLVRIAGEVLEVARPQAEPQQTPIWIQGQGGITPQQFGGLSLLGYHDRTLKTVRFTEGGTLQTPAVELELKSDRMGQHVNQWLALAPHSYQKATLGLAQLELRQVPNAASLQQLLSPPPVQAEGALGTLEVISGTTKDTLDVARAMGQTIALADGLQVQVRHFWPDFRLDDQNQPMTASQALRNPAVQLELTHRGNVERWFVFAQPKFEPIHAVVTGEPLDRQIRYQIQPQTPDNYLRVVVAPDQQLYYAAQSSQGFQSGTLKLGQSIQPGWADFQVTLTQILTHAQIERRVVLASEGSAEGTPALLVATPDGQKQWLQLGEPMAITTDNGDYFAAFSPQMRTLPFMVDLEDFIVDRNEGSESVAMWTSKIQIQDPHQGVGVDRTVWMNHPTWYRGWKIAQASWNPGDLHQSTLQMKWEPLWITALTWSGALLVVSGIGVMFYGPTGSRWIKQVSTPTSRKRLV